MIKSTIRTVSVKSNARLNGEYFFVCVLSGFTSAKIRIIARNFYNLYVNGQFVNYGPVRAAHKYLRVDEIDLSPYLKRDKNYITADVVYYDTITLSSTREGLAFGAEILSSDGGIVKQTEDFKCYEATDRVELVERYSSQRGFVEFYKQSKDRSDFYRGNLSIFPERETENVDCPTLLKRRAPFNENVTLEAQKIGEGSLRKIDGKEFVNDLINEIDSKTALNSYSRNECEFCMSRAMVNITNGDGDYGKYELYKFDYDRTGKIRLKVEVLSDEVDLYCSYDEVLSDGDVCFNRESIIQAFGWRLKKGVYDLTTFEPYCMQYLKLHAIGGELKVNGVEMLVIENPLTKNFSAKCADENIEQIINSAKHSF